MQVFIAICGIEKYTHSLPNCIQWAEDKVKPVKILRARAGERYAKIVAEIVDGEIRPIKNGDSVKVKSLLK